MKIKRRKSISFILQLMVISSSFDLAVSLPIILPTSAILLPNVGQYLTLIQILVLKLVIYTQIMRLLGQDYVGKGIKSTVPLSEQEQLDDILDYDDVAAEDQLKTMDVAESQTVKAIQPKSPLNVPIEYANKVENVFKRMQYSNNHDCLIRLMCEIGADKKQLYNTLGKQVKRLFRGLGKPTPGSAEYFYHNAFNVGLSSGDELLCANTFIRCAVYDVNRTVNIATNLMASLFPNFLTVM